MTANITTKKKNRAKPIRTCIVCGGRFDKGVLIRMTFRRGKVLPDMAQTAAGRGCYTCRSCAERLDLKTLRRAFRNNGITKENAETLRQEIYG